VIGLPVAVRRRCAWLATNARDRGSAFGRRDSGAAMNRRDRGAIAPLVAVMISSGVLIGMAALVVDVGNMYAERGQLQNGADAAALKSAQVCARKAADCVTASLNDLVGQYARDNARRGEAGASVCGRGGDLPGCPAPQGNLSDCVRPAPTSGNYVEVHTNTLGPDGSTLLPPFFANAVVDGFKGVTVTSCARFAWGAPTRAQALGMTISICDWERYTNNGAAFPAVDQAIAPYDATDPTACGIAGTASTNRGGFRWLDNADPSCRATVSVGSSYDVTPGDSRPSGCPDALSDLLDPPQPVLVPIFGSVSVNGPGNETHRVQAFAAFVVTGWHLPGSDSPSQTRSSCDNGGTSCVFGYFTKALVSGGGAVGGPDLGARIVAPIG
jgi:hypothetical protein